MYFIVFVLKLNRRWHTRTYRTLYCSLLNWLRAEITKREQNLPGPGRFRRVQTANRLLQRDHAKIRLLARALDAVEEGRKVDQLRPRVHETQIHQIDRLRRLP